MIQKRIVVGGAGRPSGILIYFSDGETELISASKISEEYRENGSPQNFSIVYTVADNVISPQVAIYGDPEDIMGEDALFYDQRGEDQIYVAIPIYRDGVNINSYGIFTEEIKCLREDNEDFVSNQETPEEPRFFYNVYCIFNKIS